MKKLVEKLSVFFIVAFLVCSAGHVVKAESRCVYKGEIYYSIYEKLYKLNPSSKSTELVKTFSNAFSLSSFNINGGKMYLTVESGDPSETYFYIYSLDLKSKKLKKLAKGDACLLEGNYIYYIETENSGYGDKITGISRMKKDGSGKKKLYSSGQLRYYEPLILYKNRLYFSENGDIKSMKLNGKGVKTEISIGNYFETFLGIDNNFLYYIEGSRNTQIKNVYRKKIGSSSKELVVSGGVYGADIQDNVLYYFKSNSYLEKGAVYRKNLKSGKISKIYSGSGIGYIQCCGRWLYLRKHFKMSSGSSSNTQDFVITISGKKVKDLQKYFVS